MSDYEDQDDLQPPWAGIGVVAVLVPLAAASVGLMVGLGLGGAAAYFVATGEQAEQAFIDNLGADDVRFGEVCAPAITEAQTELATVNSRLHGLEKDIAAKEAKVDELRSELERRNENGRAFWAQFQQAKEELAQVKQERDMLEIAKVQLVEELTRTVQKLAVTEEKLEETIEIAEEYRYESHGQNYERFVNESQLAICEKGNRKKLGQCRETVTALLNAPDIHAKFLHCLNSGQATPAVGVIEKDASLPDFSYYLDQEDRVVRDWYLNLCDPTLPETEGILASVMPR